MAAILSRGDELRIHPHLKGPIDEDNNFYIRILAYKFYHYTPRNEV